MSAVDIPLQDVHYRVFATREARKFRAFWFCPHADCYGAFRSDRLMDTKEQAIADAQNAARLHENQQHQQHQSPFRKARMEDDERVGGILIHG